MYNFTIIIPHYNIPKLLERCVSSIPNRNDIQIIVVDDCSPNSFELQTTIENLKLYKGVEFYKTTQGGSAGRARNVGLDYAKGKWLLFADADDFFDKSLSEIMDKYVDAEEDVLYFNFRSVLSDDVTKISNRESTYSDFFNKYEKDHDEDNFRFLYCTPWGKMIKRSLVTENKIRFDETKYANDAMFAVLVGCKARTILPVNIPVYVLTERSGSLASNFCCKPGETAIRAKVALRIQKVIREHKFSHDFDYQMFIRILLWNKEYKDLFDIYSSINEYGLSKNNILNIIFHTGYRYYFICLNFIFKDLLFRILKVNKHA